MIIIEATKKLVSVTLLSALAMFSGTATAKYIPYKGPAVSLIPVETTRQAAKKPTGIHATQALEHATTASIHGDAGHLSVLIEHARTTLVHAKAAEQELEGEPESHISQAVEHLSEAIKQGEMNHADVAIEHVKEAIPHIKASMRE